jgi:hypothetical protein
MGQIVDDEWTKNYRRAAEVCEVQRIRTLEKASRHYARMRVCQFLNGMSK